MSVNYKNNQRGVALVVVLLVVALVSVIATDLSGRLQREIRRSGNIFDYQQAKYYALGAEKFAIAILQQDLKDSPERNDLDQAWATEGLYFPVEGGDLTGVIMDLNRCFNVNSLVEKTEKQTFVVKKEGGPYQTYQRLLGLLSLPSGLADSLGDWLDSNEQLSSADGAEDLEYESLNLAYRAANNLMVDVSELRLVQGYTEDVFKILSPYLCALPETGSLKLNINTLDADKPEILAMLIQDFSIATAANVLAEREQSGYDNVDTFWQLDAFAGLEIESGIRSVVGLDSDYFMLQAQARIGRGRAGVTTLFKQVNKDKLQIIWRRFGMIEQAMPAKEEEITK